ncbi:MAG: hypothetical protein GYA21_10130 [Myxococcales bacterium]|nr:hypothetical protein [Myxococcales bacterium]
MWAVILVFVFLMILALSSVFALAQSRVPVVRTPTQHLDAITTALALAPGSLVVDAGCADGRLLRSLCRREGVRGLGLELNGGVWLWAWARTRLSPVRDRVRIRWADLFRQDFEEADLVYAFLMPHLLPRLYDKCAEEMRPGSLLATYLFEVPGRDPERVILLGKRKDPLHIYRLERAASPDRPKT